jgi:hypothetical protein
MNIERYPEWMYPLTKSYMLDKIGETEAYIYSALEPPWPASPRDTVVRRQWYYSPDTGSVTVTIKGLADYVPLRDKHVRGAMIIAYYQLVPTSDNTIEITYECITDPGGWLPVWLINFVLVYAPYTSIKKIRSCQPFEEYKRNTYDFISPRLLTENNPENHSQDQMLHAIPREHDSQDQMIHAIPMENDNRDRRKHANPKGVDYQEELNCNIL